MKNLFRTSLLILLFSSITSAQNPVFNIVQKMIDSVSIENITSHIEILERAGGHYSRVNFTPGNDSAAIYIYEYLSSLPNANIKVDTFFIESAQPPYNQKAQFNFEISFPGEVEEYYIIGAHYDASASRMGTTNWNNNWRTLKAPGADDNASGVASILEMARILSDTSFSFTNYETIKLVAFGAEELGPAYSSNHHGSKYYAKEARLRNDSIMGMISLDMIGYNTVSLFNAIVANEASVFLGEMILNIKDLFSIDINMNASPFAYGVYSDHQSFWDEGYSAVLIIENAPPWNNNPPYYSSNPYYHTSYDTLGTLNLPLIEKVAQLNLATLGWLTGRIITSADDKINITLNDFQLYQNYPNPFNPATRIKFTVPGINEPGSLTHFTTLKVYDLLGSEVAVLINEEKAPGNYEVSFNAASVNQNLSSGIYFYTLSSGNFIETKKMILLR
jgi:hypothetical protein